MDLKDPNIERDIVKKCVNGNRKAQEQLYKFYYGRMMGVCYRYSSNADDAKDLLQEAFTKVFRGLKKYSSTGSLEGWIRRIVVNTAIDRHRKSKKAHFINDDPQLLDNNNQESADTIYSQFGEADIMEAIQQLSPAYKTVFNLYVFENLQHKEIAERLNINEGTSKSNLAKARQNLKAILNKKNDYRNG